jgi:hypothetical protein
VRSLVLSAVLALVGAVAVSAQESVLVLQGGTLIDGRGGPPIEDAAVVVHGDRISAVGRRGRGSDARRGERHPDYRADDPPGSDRYAPAFGTPDLATIPDALRARFEHHFDDFYPRVPEREPAPGTSWQDTIPGDGDLSSGMTVETITTHSVRGDTIVEGSRATVITHEITGGAQAAGTADQGVPVMATFGVRGDGLAIVDWARSRLIHYRTRMQVAGVARLQRGGQDVEVMRKSMSVVRMLRLAP